MVSGAFVSKMFAISTMKQRVNSGLRGKLASEAERKDAGRRDNGSLLYFGVVDSCCILVTCPEMLPKAAMFHSHNILHVYIGA